MLKLFFHTGVSLICCESLAHKNTKLHSFYRQYYKKKNPENIEVRFIVCVLFLNNRPPCLLTARNYKLQYDDTLTHYRCLTTHAMYWLLFSGFCAWNVGSFCSCLNIAKRVVTFTRWSKKEDHLNKCFACFATSKDTKFCFPSPKSRFCKNDASFRKNFVLFHKLPFWERGPIKKNICGLVGKVIWKTKCNNALEQWDSGAEEQLGGEIVGL